MELTIKLVDNFLCVKKVEDNNLSAVASNATIDRDGEIILPSAFVKRLDTYRKNPVIMSSHVHRSMDARPTIIGSAKRIDVTDDALDFDMQFASTPLAKEWNTLFKEGHAKAFSVGFIPRKGENREYEGKDIYTHTEVDLLEISAVSVPSNPDALSRGLDVKGVMEKLKELEKLFNSFDDTILKKLNILFADMQSDIKDLLDPQMEKYNREYADVPRTENVEQEKLLELKTALEKLSKIV